MNVREENAARALIQGFLKDSVPEYIKDTGQEILNSGGVHKLTIRKEGDTWDVEGIVQGEDFQNYSPHLMLNPGDSQISYNCNCHEAFMGVCRHVAATALKMFADLDKDYGAPEEPQRLNTEWRQSFRQFLLQLAGAGNRTPLLHLPVLSRTGPPHRGAFPGTAEQDRPVLRPSGNVAGADPAQSRVVRSVSPALAGRPPDRPLPRLLRAPDRNSGRPRFVVLLGHPPRILHVLEGHGHPMHHREHAAHREAPPRP